LEIIRIKQRKISEEIAEQLKGKILSGELVPGQKLPSSREFSEMYQVGMSTVREALSALKAMGLVESRQGEGSYIRKFDLEQLKLPSLDVLLMNRETILELLEVRKSLEVSNAALAAEKRTDEDLAEFERIMTMMEQHLGNEAQGESADLSFHRTLAFATHNSIMIRLLETISTQMEIAIKETRRLQMYASSSVSERLWQEHRSIYEAVKKGDREGAMDAMNRHLQHVETVLFEYLK
jgi:GntR family transcriptional repressor for pyruvate dehydrogenase complex